MLQTIVKEAIHKYRDKAIALGYLTEVKHLNIMTELEDEAERYLRDQFQAHLDEHYKDGTECEDIVNMSELFVLSRDLLTHRYTVGEYIGRE